MTNLNAEIAVATRAAQQAGTLILDVYRTDFSVDWKGRGQTDPVTQADRLANTDQRVREDKPVSPAFLFACLLWHEVAKRWEALV